MTAFHSMASSLEAEQAGDECLILRWSAWAPFGHTKPMEFNALRFFGTVVPEEA